MKCPHQLAGTNIKCAYSAAWSSGGIFRNRSSRNDQVFVNRGRRGHRVLSVREFVCHSRTQIDHTIGAKALTGLPRLSVQADHASVECAVQDAPILPCFALPIGDATVLEEFALGATCLRIELPDFLPVSASRAITRFDGVER